MEKVAICITTHNRHSVFKKSYDQWYKLKPANAGIFVVDDASIVPVPEANYRFDSNVGIARAKNKCLELAKGYDHVFLVDDDIFPVKDGWEVAYTRSGYKHLQLSFMHNSQGTRLSHSVFIKDHIEGYDIYNMGNGCLYYLTKEVIDKVGGMRPEFGKWSHEHIEYSQRIYNAGLTPYPFMTPIGSIDDFWIGDYYGITSSVPQQVRIDSIKNNKGLLDKYKDSHDYVDFSL